MKFNLNHVRIRVAVESYKAEEIERQQHQQKLKKRDQHTHAQLFGRQMKSHKKSRFARSDWVSKQKKNEEEIFFSTENRPKEPNNKSYGYNNDINHFKKCTV